MDTQHLQAFVAIADTGSFSAAAEKLHLTQPAISKRIALLEEQVKASLFDRVGRQVVLTQAGSLLLGKAKSILSDVQAAQRAIADLKGDVSGQLSLATSHHIGLHYLPPYLREFSTKFPQVTLDLHFLDSEHAYHEILIGRFDLALVTLAPEQEPRIASQCLWQDQLQFVVAATHPLASAPTLRLADLSQHQAILPDIHTYTTRMVKALFDREGLALNITMATNHLDAIKMMLSVGLGWGILPSRLVDQNLQALRIEHPPIIRQLGFIHHSQRSLTNAAREFVALLQKSS